MHDEDIPVPTFGNEPQHGDRVVVFAVEAGLDTVRKVTASEAARMLGVSPGRVTQMLGANQLEGWREGRR
ncbi:MAG: HicB family protein, partial [Atopobiaceae bacterium]|nr:HicB family protein [Atopobiaceae bacterium]